VSATAPNLLARDHLGPNDQLSAQEAGTLAALGGRSYDSVLQIGCSVGVLTELAQRCDSLVAIDSSPRAVDLARERLRLVANVEVLQAGFPEEAPVGDWDLVVCSEVLSLLERPALASAVRWLRSQLEGGASVLAVTRRVALTSEFLSGEKAHDLLCEHLSRWHALDARQPDYRLDRFDGPERHRFNGRERRGRLLTRAAAH
jgi:SAM-dependent methyltransferase